jgi:hypothetical protein
MMGDGHFTDIAKTKNPDIASIGMITGAAWAISLGEQTERIDHCWRMDDTKNIFIYKRQFC